MNNPALRKGRQESNQREAQTTRTTVLRAMKPAMKKDAPRSRGVESLDIIKRFTLEISAINRHLEEVRQLWGKARRPLEQSASLEHAF